SATLPRDPDRAEVTARMLLLGDILRRHAAVRGDKIAYVVGSDRVTYRAFHARSNQLARALARLGVGRSDRVAVMATNRTEYPIIYFAAIKLGAIVVPVNSRFAATEVATIVGHAEAETFFVAPEFADLVGTLRAEGRLPGVHRFVAIGGGLDALADAAPTDPVATTAHQHDPHPPPHPPRTTPPPTPPPPP